MNLRINLLNNSRLRRMPIGDQERSVIFWLCFINTNYNTENSRDNECWQQYCEIINISATAAASKLSPRRDGRITHAYCQLPSVGAQVWWRLFWRSSPINYRLMNIIHILTPVVHHLFPPYYMEINNNNIITETEYMN